MTKFCYINHPSVFFGCGFLVCSFDAPYIFLLTNCILLINSSTSSHLATEANVQEAIRLFTVSTMDAAKSGINQQINLTPEMANEIQVCLLMSLCLFFHIGFIC